MEVKTYPQGIEKLNSDGLRWYKINKKINIKKSNIFRKAVDSAQSQLDKGREMFSSIIFPLADLSSTWSHRGLICLPNIENRGELRHHGITEEEIKVSNERNTKYWNISFRRLSLRESLRMRTMSSVYCLIMSRASLVQQYSRLSVVSTLQVNGFLLSNHSTPINHWYRNVKCTSEFSIVYSMHFIP